MCQSRGTQERGPLLFNRSVPPFVSALVVLGYVVLLPGGSLYVVKRRDMAGECSAWT